MSDLAGAWAGVEKALIEVQGDDDGFAVNIAYWPEFPKEPWAVSAAVDGDPSEVQVTAYSLPSALLKLAAALTAAKP